MPPALLPAESLKLRISEVLSVLSADVTLLRPNNLPLSTSAVMLPVGIDRQRRPCIVFNKRSDRVRQPGDLCFPGGSPEPKIDSLLAALLRLPGSPLRRWPHFAAWRNHGGQNLPKLTRMLAAGLRESFEEMRLNPFSVHFLGPLPAQQLEIFPQIIHPMAAWVDGSPRYRPNWEVQRIVRIRIEDLLDPSRYRRYRITYAPGVAEKRGRPFDEFPAYRHRGRRGAELLWGATFRITAAFLELIFGFTTPDTSALPLVEGRLDESYYGNRLRAHHNAA